MTLASFWAALANGLRSAVRLSTPTVRKASAMSPQDWLGLTGHIIALVIALTSTIGVYNFGVGLTGQSLALKMLLFPVAVFVGALLQIVIISCIKLMVREWGQNWTRVLLAGMILVLMWCITVGASYGSYWNVMSREGYEKRATEQAVSTAVQPLERARSSFAAAAQALGAVSGHADRMMSTEDSEGKSCGYNAGVGQGDRWRLRQRQKDEAAGHASALGTLNGSLSRSLGAMNATDDAALANAYRAASDTLTDPAVGMAQQWIGEQRAGFTGGFTTNGATFSCADPQMVGLLDAAVASLKALPKVPPNPPRVTQLSNAEGILLSFARLFGFGQGDDLVQDSDYVPLLFPALIELIMTALIVLGELGRPRGFNPGGQDGYRPRRPLDPSLAGFQMAHAGGSNALDLHDQIVNHLIELEGAPTVCFVVPTKPGEDRNRARKLLLLCARHGRSPRGGTHPLTPYRQRMPFAELPSLVTEGWPWRSRHVDVHLLPRTLADEVRRRLGWQAEAELFPT